MNNDTLFLIVVAQGIMRGGESTIHILRLDLYFAF